jgi:hypothetical protein
MAGTVAAGEISQFAVAFTVCSYLPGLTAIAIGMTDVAGMSSQTTTAQERAAVSKRSARWSTVLVAPVLGVAATVGAAVLAGISPDNTNDAADFGRLFALLGPWLVATVLLWSTLPTVLARTRGNGLVRYVPVIVAVHVIATLAGRAIADFNGVVVAMAVAPLVGAFGSWALTGVMKYVPAIVRDVVAIAAATVVVFAPIALITQ